MGKYCSTTWMRPPPSDIPFFRLVDPERKLHISLCMNLGKGTPQIITKLTTFLAVTDLGGILVAGLMMKSLSV